MGSLGCPLCCRQHFESVGTLRDHLIYYIYRPLQCGVCCLHLAGVQEFTHHLTCHMGDELPAAAKLSSSKPSLPVGESNCQDSPLSAATGGQDGVGTDYDAGIGTTHLSDDYNYMKGSDAANQLLKLREWRLEKLGKTFSRHRASFGKSPGLLELSPSSGRLHRSSPPASVRDLNHDRRPSSQNSSYVARSDVLLLNKDIDSVERCDSSATPLSIYGNVGSAEISDHSVCPESVGKEMTEEAGFCSPAQPVSASHEVHSHPLENTTHCTMKQMDFAASLIEEMPNPSIISEGDNLPSNKNIQGYGLSESNMFCDVDVSHQSRSALSPSLYVPTSQEITSSNLQSSGNEFETIQGYDICGTNFTEPLDQANDIDNDMANADQYEGNRFPVLETMNSPDLRGGACPQYHELQPVSHSRQQKYSETASGLSDIWTPCPDSGNSAVCNPSETLNISQLKTKDSCSLTNSQLSSLEDNFNNKTTICSYLPTSIDEGHIHPEVMNTGKEMTKTINSDDTKLSQSDSMKGASSHFSGVECNTALSSSAYEAQGILESECEEPYSSLVNTKPYLHKKFHHDQERKVLPSAGVDPVADVSQYINSLQSVLVRKLNGTLSTSIPMTSSICSTSVIKPEKELNQVNLEEHSPQAKEHICEVCHKVLKNQSSLQLHSKEHEKEEDQCGKGLYRKCPKDPCESKQGKKEKFQCDICSKVFPKAFSISRHMKEVHAVKKSFSCVQCSKAFSSKRHLEEHSRIHKGEKTHKCSQCDHQCHTASGLRTHIQEIHSSASEQRSHCCKVCGEKFAKIYGLKRHTQRKHAEQQLACNVCSKMFACKEDLNKHTKSHLSAGTLKCDSCQKTFTTSWALQRHSTKHQSLHFKCNLCNFKFTRKDSLVSHLKVHSQKKSFVCYCGKRFVKKSQLKAHQVKHSDISRYTCTVCKHSFKFKVSLKNHSCKTKTVQTNK
ncbi:B-cell lymphoma 6 protein homolog [Portunus trituberculatus]|nr:B-cell lymphoma 6 protein homolog [Portunus trituberculatus]XP_045131980.1 B-cell lymphoma 6 protein homolog [Portunus trituberculatus]